MAIIDRNGGDCREKNYVSVEIIIHTVDIGLYIMLFVIEIVSSICKLAWFLNSSFLQFLAATLHINVSGFSPTLLSGNH